MKSQSRSLISSGSNRAKARGVITKAATPPEPLAGFREHAGDFGDALKVGTEQLCTAALLGGTSRLGFGAVIVNSDARTFARQPPRDAAADAPGRAGDQHHLSRKARLWARHAPPLPPARRLRAAAPADGRSREPSPRKWPWSN